MSNENTQPISGKEEITYLTRRPGKAAMRHLYMHSTKTERWVWPKCYRKLYHTWDSRRHDVLEDKALSHPDGSPVLCYHCKRLIIYRNQKYVGPGVNGTPQEVTATHKASHKAPKAVS